MVALHDFTEVGDTEVFIDEPQIEFMEQQMLERGYLDNRKMANMFNLLRSNDLIWSNVVNNYLLGQKPPAFDLLYWNSDGTRMARDAHSFFLRNTHLENNLIKPGKVEIKGRPIDLPGSRATSTPSGRRRPHRPLGLGVEDLQARERNHPLHPRQLGPHSGNDQPSIQGQGPLLGDRERRRLPYPRTVARTGQRTRGAPGGKIGAWLDAHSGEMVDPPEMGSEAYPPPIEDAPGTYVKEK